MAADTVPFQQTFAYLPTGIAKSDTVLRKQRLMPKLAGGTVANKALQAERSASCLAPSLSSCHFHQPVSRDWAAQLCQLCIGQSENMVATGST